MIQEIKDLTMAMITSFVMIFVTGLVFYIYGNGNGIIESYEHRLLALYLFFAFLFVSFATLFLDRLWNFVRKQK